MNINPSDPSTFLSINDSPRRITNFVRKEAYRWLKTKIRNNEYFFGTGNGTSKLFANISASADVDKKDETYYEEFLQYFENNPYSYAMLPKKQRSENGILLVTSETILWDIKDSFSLLDLLSNFLKTIMKHKRKLIN